jgi:hypothetical protein
VARMKLTRAEVIEVELSDDRQATASTADSAGGHDRRPAGPRSATVGAVTAAFRARRPDCTSLTPSSDDRVTRR